MGIGSPHGPPNLSPRSGKRKTASKKKKEEKKKKKKQVFPKGGMSTRGPRKRDRARRSLSHSLGIGGKKKEIKKAQ